MPTRTTIKPGAELEMFTPDEIAAAVVELIGKRPPDDVQGSAGGTLTAAGGGKVVCYVVPAGKRFVLTRLVVKAAGFTPAAPYTAAGAYVEVLRNDSMVDFLPLTPGSGGSLPAISVDSDDSGPVFKNGDELAVLFVAGPASGPVIVDFRGILREPME